MQYPSYILPVCAYNPNLPDLRQRFHVSPAPGAGRSRWNNYQLIVCWARPAARMPQWARSHPRCWIDSFPKSRYSRVDWR